MSKISSWRSLALVTAVLLTAPGAWDAHAQSKPIPKSQYPSALPKPTQKYPEYVAPARLSSPYEVFWEGVKRKESNATHWESPGVPIAGRWDPAGIISIGISQVAFTYRGQPVGPEKAADAGIQWSWDRYLYDPIYNERLGRGIFEKNLKQFNNNPCAAMWAYNAGDGAAMALRDGRRSANGTAWEFSPGKDSYPGERNKWVDYVSKTSAFSLQAAARYGYSEEVAKILQTTPGCSDKMVDVDPAIVKPAVEGPYTGPPIEGYCAPQASQLLAGKFQARQKDLDETFEPLFRSIKNGGEAVAGSQGSGTGTGGGGSSGGSGSAGGSTASVMESSYNQLSSCVDLSWPTLSIQYPTMDQIIRGVAKEAVRRACSEARSKLSEQRSHLTGAAWLNTRIPGVPSFGVTTTGSGGDNPLPSSGGNP